jgi:alpha-L-rhamnosidase
MLRFVILYFFLTTTIFVSAQKLAVTELTTENKVNPMGVEGAPRFSWKLKAEGNNIVQTAYEIRVAGTSDFKNVTWTSGKVNSDQSVYVIYQGPTLKPASRYYWQVKVWDNRKGQSGWSSPAFLETGLTSQDWKAIWIEPKQDTVEKIPSPCLRKEFKLSKQVASARVYVTSHGFYELSINGKKVGDQVLTPGWTSYNKRLQYQIYDVTSLLHSGSNVVGAILGDGWYRGRLGWMNTYGIWGKKLGLLCQINVTYSDGTVEIISSDKNWKTSSDGPVVMNSIYDGETYDSRKEIKGWDQAGFDDALWSPVMEASYDNAILIVTETVPVRKIEEIKPKKIFRTPKGTLVADMGQNMVGWIRLNVKGAAGTKVVIRHAEVLDKYGEFYTENLRSAATALTYILRGDKQGETYEPRFSFFGFRYIAIDGFPGEVNADNITGVVVHSDMTRTGTFECSNPLVNQLQHNILWGQKGNFVDVPTDCPQRDERLGWTGDAQAFCRTASFNMNVSAFFTKWLKDVSADQLSDGKVPWVIPNALPQINATSAGWGDVSTITPWTMFLVYGDRQLLERQYPSMKEYVTYIEKTAGESMIWKGGSIFGDWLYYKPRMEDHTVPDGHTQPDMIATMFYAYSSGILAQAAIELGKKDDAVYYENLFQKIKKVFNQEYLTASGRISSDSQTSYVLALMFDLLTDEMKVKATNHLVNDIKGRENHLSTGFLGTPYLCHVLSSNGQTKVAYDLLLQETFPSWLFPVKMGATTIWERWDGQKPDSTFQDKGMNSFNHYAYGAIGDWLYRVVAGIEIGKPGYKQIIIQPHPDRRLTHAKATFNCPYGEVVSGWKLEENQLNVSIVIPANTTAIVRLPSTTVSEVTSGAKSLQQNPLFRNVREEGGKVVLEVGSGAYIFNYPFREK